MNHFSYPNDREMVRAKINDLNLSSPLCCFFFEIGFCRIFASKWSFAVFLIVLRIGRCPGQRPIPLTFSILIVSFFVINSCHFNHYNWQKFYFEMKTECCFLLGGKSVLPLLRHLTASPSQSIARSLPLRIKKLKIDASSNRPTTDIEYSQGEKAGVA